LYNKLGRENIFNVRAEDSHGNIVKEYGVHIYAATVIGTNAYNVKVSERRAAYKLSAGGNIPMACIDTD